MDIVHAHQILPIAFILKANIMICTTMSQCGVHEFQRRLRNTTETQCVPCRGCPSGYREISPCSNVTDTECERCPKKPFYKLTDRDKMCQMCRRCALLTEKSRCSNDTTINCSKDCKNAILQPSCKPCSVCRRNEFVKTICTTTEDTVCKRCKHCRKHYFIIKKCSHHNDTRCKQCRRCVKGKSYVYEKCRRHRNTQCRRCSTCPRGSYVQRKCTRHRDTKCAPCPKDNVNDVMCNRCPRGTYHNKSSSNQTDCVPCSPGTYMDLDRHDLGICKKCRDCLPHEETVQTCNSTHNTQCGPCSHGYFRLPSSHTCAKCSECQRNQTNFTGLVVDECWQQMNGTNKICMPSASTFGSDQDKYRISNEAGYGNETKSDIPRHQIIHKETGNSSAVFTTTNDGTEVGNGSKKRLLFVLRHNKDRELFTTTTFFTHGGETLTSVKDGIQPNSSRQILSFTVIAAFLLILFLLIVIVMKFKRQRSNGNDLVLLKKHVNKQDTVSIPTLFSTNSITDCFDLSIQYDKTNAKYNSDPEFLKWKLNGDFKSLCMNDRKMSTLYSKSRSLGTVNAVEFEFWNDNSLPRKTCTMRYNA